MLDSRLSTFTVFFLAVSFFIVTFAGEKENMM